MKSMRYRYYTCDVFTETRFGGNTLAVLPEAVGLSTEQMQRIAREFNYPETSFVFPARNGHTRHVRIFTPVSEVPFAGHPNIGTAFVLASTGRFGDIRSSRVVIFEEEAGLVSITIDEEEGRITRCELEAPQPFSLGQIIPAELIARAISLSTEEIVTETHLPRIGSVGLPFVIAQVSDRSSLERARVDISGFHAIDAEGVWPSLHLYVRGDDGFDIRARMFAPLAGVPEDPATGSANCALAGLLAHHDPRPDGDYRLRIAQGVEMGRPSTLIARARKTEGVVQSTWIGGSAVLVCEGMINVD